MRCLEVALHPNTDDGEVLAAVNGFRRTAQGMPLRDLCAEFAVGEREGRAVSAEAARWRPKLDRLHDENLALRRRLKQAEDRYAAAEARAAALEAAAMQTRRTTAPPAADNAAHYVDRPEAPGRRRYTPAPEPMAAPPRRATPFQTILDAVRAQPWRA
jgi:hypothetical protein